ncbi:hypothetical protein [Lederbergia panacisoli]|uniref:hypothetical protein n=1 Tax=Lederbergia panacisoli TaxID=1255251 RepID=UPI00214BE3F4|nr:hypothetical protein [Lederbergia panacisoli]MCR2822283.1 hypothetical protein [Lederbergia panacisoli]
MSKAKSDLEFVELIRNGFSLNEIKAMTNIKEISKDDLEAKLEMLVHKTVYVD